MQTDNFLIGPLTTRCAFAQSLIPINQILDLRRWHLLVVD